MTKAGMTWRGGSETEDQEAKKTSDDPAEQCKIDNDETDVMDLVDY
jgi:hypothetical protein